MGAAALTLLAYTRNGPVNRPATRTPSAGGGHARCGLPVDKHLSGPDVHGGAGRFHEAVLGLAATEAAWVRCYMVLH